MSEGHGPTRKYGYVGPTGSRPPDYARVARALPDDELEEEIRLGRGEPEYLAALVAELDRRARDGVPS